VYVSNGLVVRKAILLIIDIKEILSIFYRNVSVFSFYFYFFFNAQVAKRSVLIEEKLLSFLDKSEVIMHE
jgi:hypothetical protein